MTDYKEEAEKIVTLMTGSDILVGKYEYKWRDAIATALESTAKAAYLRGISDSEKLSNSLMYDFKGYSNSLICAHQRAISNYSKAIRSLAEKGEGHG